MIKHEDAIRTARSLIGTPYKKMDCIALIRAIIRQSPGGVKDYRCEGTNWLWDSIEKSGKYQHLTERYEGIENIPAGGLAFKRYGKDGEDHVGIATGTGAIIHSSSEQDGRGVVETPLSCSEGWDCWGKHRYIETAQESAESEETGVENYKAIVKLNSGVLHVRNEPGTGGDIIGRLNNGAVVDVLSEYDNGWKYVSYGDSGSGYVSGEYLVPYEEPDSVHVQLVFTDSAGNKWIPVGDFKARLEIADD